MATTLLNPLYPRPHYTAAGVKAPGVFLTVGTSAAGTSFTSGQFDSSCELVVFDVQTSGVCFTLDGSTPVVGSNGHLVAVGTNYTWQRGALLSAQFIGNGATAYIYASQWSM